jgi:hypothetical protein
MENLGAGFGVALCVYPGNVAVQNEDYVGSLNMWLYTVTETEPCWVICCGLSACTLRLGYKAEVEVHLESTYHCHQYPTRADLTRYPQVGRAL